MTVTHWRTSNEVLVTLRTSQGERRLPLREARDAHPACAVIHDVLSRAQTPSRSNERVAASPRAVR
jgi:hypothetical protein